MVHKEVYWRRLHEGWQERLSQGSAAQGWEQAGGASTASLLQSLGCTQSGSLCLGEVQPTASLTGHARSLVLQPSGCRQSCASASAGPGTPCGREAAAQGLCCEAGCPKPQQGHSRATSNPRSEAVTWTNLSTLLLWAPGAELAGLGISPTGRWMQPPVAGLRRFNTSPWQMVQDQRSNLLPPPQLPHPRLSPAPTELWVLSSPLLPHQGAGEGDTVTMGSAAHHCCQCGQRQLSTSQWQHNPLPVSWHTSLAIGCGEVHGKWSDSSAERAALGAAGDTGTAGLPYREQYHSFRQREHRLAASVPHTLQRGLSGARASIMSRL